MHSQKRIKASVDEFPQDHVRILAVDDEPYILDLYQELLSSSLAVNSFELTVCGQGEEAVEEVRSANREGRPYALAFIDLCLPPGPDGVWTGEEIRKLDPNIEIVIVTGHSTVDLDQIARRIQPVHKLLYIHKPFHSQEIQHCCTSLCSKWRGERELRKVYRELELRVEERTAELARVNEQLAHDIRVRQRAEEELQHTLSQLRKAMGGVIQAMALTVETRDPYTAGHQRRVSDLARAIATRLELSPHQIEGIRMAAVIHDLGKVSVPAEILTKPGRLNEIEFGLIKSHPQVAYEILKGIEFPWPIAQIVCQHHERNDGSGYPLGISAEDILIEARVIAVADVVEAMASHRPYRPSLGINMALDEIARNKGSTYDSDVVTACLSLFTREGYSFK